MEMMITMGYDAMAIGNHEFEYGWESFAEQKSRLPFPVLGANLFYADTGRPYAQPYTIVERDGFRIGVVGIMGQDEERLLFRLMWQVWKSATRFRSYRNGSIN